ncbi:MAG: YfhO family protein [Smithella sp.]|jgi:uncharacterized membrane protein YfhO
MNERIRIEVTSVKRGVVVLSESSYPGWRVTVNGKLSKIIRLNYLFQGVEVDSGRQQIQFEYQPPFFLLLMDIVFYFFNYNAIMIFSSLIETQDIVNVHEFYLKGFFYKKKLFLTGLLGKDKITNLNNLR